MKIRDILLTLLKSGQDFNYHGMRVDVSGEPGPMHGRDCSFCAAWADALYLLTESIALRDVFDFGNEVAIGDVTGIVENVDIVYTVRLTGADGERRYVKVASEYVSAPPGTPPAASPLLRYFSDHAGDIWRAANAAGDMLILDEANGVAVSSKGQAEFTRDWVEQTYGPLVPVKR